jgi:hypothetical protein
MHPRARGRRHSSAGIHHVIAWQNNFTTKARIIAMITLTPGKLAPIKVGFSMKDPVH